MSTTPESQWDKYVTRSEVSLIVRGHRQSLDDMATERRRRELDKYITAGMAFVKTSNH